MKILLRAAVICTLVRCDGWVSHAEAVDRVANGAFTARLEQSINDYRAQQRLPKLKREQNLADLAVEHSVQMAKAGRLSHEGFVARVERSGHRMCVENVGWNYPTPDAQMKGWQQSVGHDTNLRDARVASMGVGVSEGYVTFIACD